MENGLLAPKARPIRHPLLDNCKQLLLRYKAVSTFHSQHVLRSPGPSELLCQTKTRQGQHREIVQRFQLKHR